MRLIPFELLLLWSGVVNATWFSTARPVTDLGTQHQAVLGFHSPSVQTGEDPKAKKNAHRQRGKYRCFEDSTQLPTTDEWLSFKELWQTNRQTVLSQNGGDTYVEHYLQKGIFKVADESHVDPRLLFTLILQESHGRVSTGCKAPHSRCGLLQTPFETPLFDETRPEASILQILREGVLGVELGTCPGHRCRSLAQYIGGQGTRGTSQLGDAFAAVMAYKADSMAAGTESAGDVVDKPELERFVSDIANRLIGWHGRGKHKC